MEIYHPTDIHPFAMPSADDLASLLSIARNSLFPGVKPLSDAAARDYFVQFCSAFSFVATLRRTDGFKERLGDWVGRCEVWHDERGTPCSMSLGPLTCACLASGDIKWRAPADRWPFDVFAGLSWSEGRKAVPAWRTVLSSKLCLVPTPAPANTYSQQPATIRQLNMLHGQWGAKPFE